ncbi:hypothetical protein QFC19_003949 [Naganishia cerealis]|uniref:Uncharacterized protein n=1 Tax=Naganishia cerealis TaxID=610337 RepID=A0ACC2W0A1_9TREE|nr:hypothetical protein QFC19_003949 [Naganishia cerealis]
MVSLSRKNSDLELPTTVHHDSPAGYYQLVKLRSRSWALHSQRRKYLKGIGIIIVIIGFTFLLCRPNQASLAERPDDWNAVDQQEGENRMWSETDTDVWGLDKDTLHPNPMRPAVSVGIDHAAARLVEGLVPLEDNDPNPTVQSVLGQEAENAYVYGSRTLDDYFTSLSTFIDLALPQSMSKILHVSLERYAENKHPKWYLSGDSDRLPGLGEKSGTRNIWQTDANSEHAESAPVASWRENGEGWKWMLLNDADAAGYVSKHLKKSKLKAVWDALPSGILHSDMLRYLVLLIEGGIYSDTDTKRLKPISEWGRGARLWRDGRGWLYGNDSGIELGDELRGVENDDLTPPSVVVGIEADVGDREDWHDWWPRPGALPTNFRYKSFSGLSARHRIIRSL